MESEPPCLDAARLRKLGVVVGVSLAHLGVFSVMGRADAPVPLPAARAPVSVFLYRPPPPPPPPTEAAVTGGGGAPAAASRVHVPEKPVERPPELVAPPAPAPEPERVVGAAPVAGPLPGSGQGGEGTGTGSGSGQGGGPGSGGTRERFLRGPSMAELARAAPRGGPDRTVSVRMRCRIRLDTRLEDCRVLNEEPAGMGYGPAALAGATHFRFQPPTEGGRPVAGREVIVGVEFPARRY